ncbi:MAG: TetR family transcriptional regulator C-terminal domain-containing protein [Clostridiales bacterium]|nr:TetR family transcriptional regulator C-terminal domain-containing protein [Clostridiales bacterium]
MEKRVDRRTIKTKRAIKHAFIELVSRKSIDSITITDISREADINRKTFYNNYSGIHEIISEIEEELFETFKAEIKDLDVGSEMQNPYNVLIRLTRLLDSNYQFYNTIRSSDLNTHLMAKIIGYLKEQTKKVLKARSNYDEYEMNVVIDYSISGMLSVYQEWLNSGREEPIEKLAHIISNLFYEGVEKHVVPKE